MDKQTVLAFTLIGIIFMVWVYLNSPQPVQQKQPAKTTAIDSAKQQAAAAAQQQTAAAQQAAGKAPALTEDTTGSAKLFPNWNLAEQIITIDNEVARFELSNKGGKIKKVFLKQYNNWFVPTDKKDSLTADDWIQLLNVKKGSSVDLEFITNDGKKITTAFLGFTSSVAAPVTALKGTDSLTVHYTFTTTTGQKITKSFTFYGNRYDTRFALNLSGMQELISGGSADLVWDAGIRFVEANSADEATYANASVYTGGEQVKVDAPASGEVITKDFNGKVDWICARNKYFAAILSPDSPQALDGAFVKGYAQHYAQGGIREFYSLRYKLPIRSSVTTTSFLVYIGPVTYATLKHYNRKFNDIVDFGSFFGLRMVVRPIAEYLFLPLFNFLHTFIPNYGWVIVIFSLIIKILLHPLTRSSLRSMQRMQLLQPKITEIKEKYKDDQNKVSKETMKLYSTYGINPMGGCLPMLLQMPIFIALWGLFQGAVELRQQPFLWWITDLSRPDIILHLPFRVPIFGVDQISALATLMGLTMFIQQKMSIKDPQQQAMVYVMPVMFLFIFMNFPAGLNLYYFLFNVLSIAQQYYTTHHMKGVELVPVKPKTKKGFMERMLAAAEEKAKAQQSGKRSK